MRLLGGGGVAPPAAPSGLTATAVSPTQIDLEWDDNAGTETGYRVYRSTDGETYALLATLAADATSHNDDTITGGTAYWYKVSAYNAGGEALSDAATANTLTLSLVAYWNLDEASAGVDPATREDSVGTSHLTDNGTTPSAAGVVSNGAHFTAANHEYLTVLDNVALSMGNIDFTISVWGKIADKDDVRDLLNKYNSYGSAQREYAVQYSAVTDRFTFIVSHTGVATISVKADTLGSPSLNTWYHIVCYHDATRDKIGIQVNGGAADEANANAAGVFDGTSPLIIGALPAASKYANAVVDEVGIWKRLLTSAEITSLYNGGSGLAHPFDGGGGEPQLRSLVVFDGNSMTDGDSSSYPETTYATLGAGWDMRNVGVSGQTTADMLADAETEVDAAYNAARSHNVVVCWEGSNDLRLGATRADAQARLVQYCQERQAAGWQVVIVTILPRTQDGLPATFEEDRTATNAYILANHGDFADAVADVAADSRIGDAGDELDATYYTDGVHMTEVGYVIVAEIVAAAIQSL